MAVLPWPPPALASTIAGVVGTGGDFVVGANVVGADAFVVGADVVGGAVVVGGCGCPTEGGTRPT